MHPPIKALFHATVMHRRLRPKVNAFVYPVMYVVRALGESVESRLLKENRCGLYSVWNKDHGLRDGSPLLPWIRGVLAEHKLAEAADGEVWLAAHPRMLGYAFNPVSFWLCFDKQERLRAVLAEVNNTFGDRHSYLLAHPDARPILPEDVLWADKCFHVSPFLPVEGRYAFCFQASREVLAFRIDYSDAGGLMLRTALTGRLFPMTDAALLRHFAAAPFMTFFVVLRIHWQAVKLWVKRARFHRRPEPPKQDISR